MALSSAEYARRVRFLREAEERGEVADSLTYRRSLIERMKCGEISHSEVVRILNKRKREAKKRGLKLRNDFFKRTF